MTAFQKIVKYLAIAFAVFLIITIISAVLTAINGLAGVLGLKKESKELDNKTSLIQLEDTNIATLDIDIAYANLKIKKGEYLLAQTNNTNIECKQDANKLKIVEKNHKWFSKNNNSEITIYIPEGLILEDVKIETGAGKIDIEEINAKKISFELGAGQTEINELNVDEAYIEGGVGRFIIQSGVINNLDFDMGIGETIISAKLLGKSEINTGIGKLKLNIDGNKEDYKINATKGLGSINIDGKDISNEEKIGNGENSIKIDGGIGSISVDFK